MSPLTLRFLIGAENAHCATLQRDGRASSCLQTSGEAIGIRSKLFQMAPYTVSAKKILGVGGSRDRRENYINLERKNYIV